MSASEPERTCRTARARICMAMTRHHEQKPGPSIGAGLNMLKDSMAQTLGRPDLFKKFVNLRLHHLRLLGEFC